MQRKKTTWYRQQSHIHALFTYICFSRVRHSREHLSEGETFYLLRTSKIPRLNTRLWHIAKRETMEWNKTTWYQNNNFAPTHFSRRNIFHALDTRKNFLEKAKSCTCWGSARSLEGKGDCRLWLISRGCNGIKLHDFDNNLTSTHFLRRHIFHAWDTHEDILVRAKSLHLLRTSKISRLNTRLWHIAKRETMQCNTTTWYRQQFHTHALFT